MTKVNSQCQPRSYRLQVGSVEEPTCWQLVLWFGLSWRWPDSQSPESMMDLGEKPFEGIGRAQFDVDPPDADFEPGGNFKKPQPDLADGGMFQFAAS